VRVLLRASPGSSAVTDELRHAGDLRAAGFGPESDREVTVAAALMDLPTGANQNDVVTHLS